MEPKISQGCKQQELGDYSTNKDKVPNAQTIQTRNLKCRYTYETWSRWHNCSRECRGRKQKQVQLEEKKEHQNVTYWGGARFSLERTQKKNKRAGKERRHKINSRGRWIANSKHPRTSQKRESRSRDTHKQSTRDWLPATIGWETRLVRNCSAAAPPEKKGNFFKSFSEVKYEWCVCRRKPNQKKLQRQKAGRWRKFRKRQQRERRSVAGTKRTEAKKEKEDP